MIPQEQLNYIKRLNPQDAHVFLPFLIETIETQQAELSAYRARCRSCASLFTDISDQMQEVDKRIAGLLFAETYDAT